MPNRILSDAVWTSDKLAKCLTEIPATTAVYYPWCYLLADANGSFELTNMRAIHSKLAVNLPFLTVEYIASIFSEFEREGLLFVWKENGKTFAHWNGSENGGLLPPKSTRKRYTMVAPRVPRNLLREYQDKFPNRVKTRVKTNIKSASRQVLDFDLDFDLDRRGRGVGLEPAGGGSEKPSPQAPKRSHVKTPTPPPTLPNGDKSNAKNKTGGFSVRDEERARQTDASLRRVLGVSG